MKLTVNRLNLLTELAILQNLIDKKEINSMLSSVNIKSNDDNSGIIIVATDLDNTLVLSMEADIKVPGELCVSGKRLYDTLRLMEDDEFSLNLKSNFHIYAECGKTKMRIVGTDATNFPAVPSFENAEYKVPADIIKQMITKATYAISNDPSRHTLSGANLVLENSSITLVSTDGLRLVFMKTKLEESYDSIFNILIPTKSLKEVAKLSIQTDEVFFGCDDNHLYFKSGERLLISRKLVGSFPDYKKVLIPSSQIGHSIMIPSYVLGKLVDKAILMADISSNVIELSFKKNRLMISSESTKFGKIEDDCEIDYTGEEFNIGVNYRYIKEFLGKMEAAKNIFIEFTIDRSRLHLREDTTNYEYKVTFSPMRL